MNYESRGIQIQNMPFSPQDQFYSSPPRIPTINSQNHVEYKIRTWLELIYKYSVHDRIQHWVITVAQEMGLMSKKILRIIVVVLTLQSMISIHSAMAIRVLHGDEQVWQVIRGLVLVSLQKGSIPPPEHSGCTNAPGNPGPKCPPTRWCGPCV